MASTYTSPLTQVNKENKSTPLSILNNIGYENLAYKHSEVHLV